MRKIFFIGGGIPLFSYRFNLAVFDWGFGVCSISPSAPHLSIFILVGYQSNTCPMTLITKCSLSTFCKRRCKTSVISSLNGRRRWAEAWRYLCRKPQLLIPCPQLLCSCSNFFPSFISGERAQFVALGNRSISSELPAWLAQHRLSLLLLFQNGNNLCVTPYSHPEYW